MNEINGQRRDTLIERLTERCDRRPAGCSGTSGGGAVIYPPPPPISTPLSSNGGGGGQHTDAPPTGRADAVFTDIISLAGDVDNGAGEAGAAGDVFSHTESHRCT